MRPIYIVILCSMVLTFGVSPELNAMTVPSSSGPGDSRHAVNHVTKQLELNGVNISPEELQLALASSEIDTYANTPISVMGGGYYGSTSSNQYSAFFGNMENFLVELVEFFLFLAMLSYVVGYEEWLPWEKDDDDSN